MKTCQDFLGETETPAVAASPATEEVEEEAMVGGCVQGEATNQGCDDVKWECDFVQQSKMSKAIEVFLKFMNGSGSIETFNSPNSRPLGPLGC